jgi:uncharacterized ferritin-like protein (DUF455 family)
MPVRPDHPPPPAGTLSRWAWDYVTTTDLAAKLDPGPAPDAEEPTAPTRRLLAPGRPPELRVVERSARTPRRGALRDPRRRASLLHTFWHHELQAAELMCWALLAFPSAPPEFRRGLVGIQRDEVRHMRLYQAAIERLGWHLGEFPVRDWFWQRVPTCRDPVQFVALLGLGLEAGNLDHSERFVEWFSACGDEQAAAIQRVIGREEVAHVRFAAKWFVRWRGDLSFERWRDALVRPLTPALFRGQELNRPARRAAGLSEDFLDALASYGDAGGAP